MRPRKLQIWLNAWAGYGGRARRETRSSRHRQIPGLRKPAELVFDGRDQVGEAACRIAREVADIVRQVDQNFQTWRYAQPPPAVGSVECTVKVPPGCVDSIFVLQAADRDHETGICHVRAIGGDVR